MAYRESREVVRLRQELRRHLLSEVKSDRYEAAAELLARLKWLAEDCPEAASPELRGEYERWKARFEIVAASARNN
jgi:hypothetical protein